MKLLKFVPLFAIVACSSGPPAAPKIDYSQQDIEYIAKYQEASGGNYKIGKPYEINDDWYFPAQEPSYDKEGIASWYGTGLEGKRTANGETFRAADYTAAMPTLPMPSIVEVTNLDNGLKVNVRVNDRGPFHSKRIIDVSKAAAKALGMLQNGTAHVRVKMLERETLEFMQYSPKQYADE